MTVFITGAKGFIGSELVVQCRKRGIEYVAADMVDASEENYYRMDINSPDIENIIPQDCEALIHLAALSRDQDCKDNAYDCFTVNVMGTLNLMKSAKKRGVKQFIFASTEWVYDNFAENAIKKESSPINPLNLTSEYALSKLVSEANLKQSYLSGFTSITILRFGIIYGPRDSNWSAVEALFHTIKTKDVVTVGSLKTGRCFIHVADVVNGVLNSIGLQGFHIINLQGDRLVTLEEIIETSSKIHRKIWESPCFSQI